MGYFRGMHNILNPEVAPEGTITVSLSEKRSVASRNTSNGKPGPPALIPVLTDREDRRVSVCVDKCFFMQYGRCCLKPLRITLKKAAKKRKKNASSRLFTSYFSENDCTFTRTVFLIFFLTDLKRT